MLQLGSKMTDAKLKPLPWWGVLAIMLGGLPLVLLFVHYGKLAFALPTLDSVAVIAFAIVLRWRLRRYAWFWMAVALFVVLHTLVILFVPWTTQWIPAFLLAPIVFADLYSMLAMLSAIEKFMANREPAER
jgi:hypothetical protein